MSTRKTASRVAASATLGGSGPCPNDRHAWSRASHRALLTSLLAALLFALPASAAQVERSRWLMGTLWLFSARTTPEDSLRTGSDLDAGLDEVAALEPLLSNWSPASALSHLNGAGSDDGLPEPLFAVIDSALALAALTQGAFDPTVEALTRAWDLRGKGRLPDARSLAAARAHVGWTRIVIDAAARRVQLNGTQLDLGGIAKGFALDRAAAVLHARGVRDVVLDAGGQLLARGESMSVGVAHPTQRERPAATVELQDASLSTSAQSERFIRAGGKRYGHVLDPRTGQPLVTHASVSVRARSATLADGLSTALLVLGREDAGAFAVAHPEVGVLWLEAGKAAVNAQVWNMAVTGPALHLRHGAAAPVKREVRSILH